MIDNVLQLDPPSIAPKWAYLHAASMSQLEENRAGIVEP